MLQRLQLIKNEAIRLWPLIAITVFCIFYFGDWSQLQAQLYIQSTICFILISAHITRKAMFPYYNLERSVKVAQRTPIGSSISILAMFILLSVIIYVSAK